MKIHSLLPALLILAITGSLSAADAPAASTPAYPLATCLVSEEALGSMGEAYVYIHKEEGKPDREVRLCCKGCLKKFAKDPAKYLGKLDAAAKPSADKPAAEAGHAH